MDKRNEPTTGEIVRAFRGAGVYGITTALELRIIDRLESQEHTIAELKYQLELLSLGIPVQMKDLTARAESAERERDAAIADIERMRKEKIPLCPICDFNDMIRCCHDSHCDGYQLFRWRGLPQEGESHD